MIHLQKSLWTAGLLLLAFPAKSQQTDRRTEFFPRRTEYVRQMPDRENLWIFLMAGQSNMAGRGKVEPGDTVPDPRILTIDSSENWIYAKEPLHFYEPGLAGLDCGMAFARRLLRSVPETVVVGMIPCAVGGSSISQWLKDDFYRGVHLMSNFRNKEELSARYGIIKGILWHQGESDTNPASLAAYPGRLDSLLRTFRSITENDMVPVLIGELGSFAEPPEKQLRRDSLNTAIHAYANSHDRVYVISTGDLCHRGDHIHFDAVSQRRMGERYAEKYLEIEGIHEVQDFFSALADSAATLVFQQVRYDPSYYTIPYPDGDVPADRGVCTDVIVRAYRKMGIDLQKEVHEDMAANFDQYPHRWGLDRPDKNIDHRRVPNLMCFFDRKGTVLPITLDPGSYKPGDIVSWDLGNGIDHIGIVTGQRSEDGQRPIIVHNIGAGQVMEDCLFRFRITGHYRYIKSDS